MFDAYMELGELVVSQGRDIAMSIDKVPKTEAVIFGYLIKDFQEFESISLWSDEIDAKKLQRRTTYYQVPSAKLVWLKNQKLSFDMKENMRLFRQLKW